MKIKPTTTYWGMMLKAVAMMLLMTTTAGLVSCGGGGGGSAASNNSAAAELAATLKGPFSVAAIDAATSALKQSGLVVAADDGTVQKAVLSAATVSAGNGLAVLRIQARSMALETGRGGGHLGSDLDLVTPPIPLPPDGTGVDKQVTFSLLIAAYVKTGNSFGAQVARGLMGDLDLARHGEYRYPTLVLYTFMQEVMVPLMAEMQAAEAGLPKGQVRKAELAAAAAGFNPADPCGSVNTFLDDLPSTVTGAVNSIGGTSSGLWNSIVSVAAVAAGVATSAATGVALGIVRHTPAVTAVRNGMTAVHALADLNAMFSQWNIDVAAAPSLLHKAPGTPTVGAFTVTLDNGSGNDAPTWPDAVKNCATLFAIPLPDFNSADGATVTWVTIAGFNDLALQDTTETTLASNQAKFNFHTASEIQAIHDNPSSEVSQGTAIVKATVSLPGMENLANSLASALAPNLNTYAQAGVNGAAAPVSQILGLTDQGPAVVEYHTLKQARINAVTADETLQAVACNGVRGTWTGTLSRNNPATGSGSSPVSWNFNGGPTAPLAFSVSMTGGVGGVSADISITETLNLQGDAVSGYSVQTNGSYTQVTHVPGYGDITQNGVRNEGYVIELGSFPECP